MLEKVYYLVGDYEESPWLHYQSLGWDFICCSWSLPRPHRWTGYFWFRQKTCLSALHAFAADTGQALRKMQPTFAYQLCWSQTVRVPFGGQRNRHKYPFYHTGEWLLLLGPASPYLVSQPVEPVLALFMHMLSGGKTWWVSAEASKGHCIA